MPRKGWWRARACNAHTSFAYYMYSCIQFASGSTSAKSCLFALLACAAARNAILHHRIASGWDLLMSCMQKAKLFTDVGAMDAERLLSVFMDYALATLRRHLSGWRP